ncbi:MAG: TatD family hydrolase [Mycoplasmataceae bacterium]|jgi:TatD DNase family protein|nr:TatD family hydrolase [Mycoplasmataceae bacterium]
MIKYKYFDTHAHVNHEPLAKNIDEIINESNSFGILINNVGTNIETSKLAIKQAKKYANVFATIGIHPCDIENIEIDKARVELEKMLSNIKKNKIIAIGETGFDFHYKKDNFLLQKKFFLMHVSLAKKYKLPIVLHIREAHRETMDLLSSSTKKLKVIIHCFDSTTEVAKKYNDLNFYVSFGGKITYQNSNDVREALSVVNLKKILVETDCPWLSPRTHKKEINKPIFLLGDGIIKEVGNVLDIEYEKISKILFKNSIELFGIKKNKYI